MNVIAIKVHCSYKIDFPTDKRREEVCRMVEESDLFNSMGKSRIDGFNIYILKGFVKRLGKLQKIKKINPNIMDKLEDLMNKIDSDVEVIPIVIDGSEL